MPDPRHKVRRLGEQRRESGFQRSQIGSTQSGAFALNTRVYWLLRLISKRGDGGGGGIRTHGTLARTTVFETAPIGHSGTPPQGSFRAAEANAQNPLLQA